MRWLDGITDSIGHCQLQEIVKDREARHGAVHGVAQESDTTERLSLYKPIPELETRPRIHSEQRVRKQIPSKATTTLSLKDFTLG